MNANAVGWFYTSKDVILFKPFYLLAARSSLDAASSANKRGRRVNVTRVALQESGHGVLFPEPGRGGPGTGAINLERHWKEDTL